MSTTKLPHDATPRGSSPTFTEETLPAALLREHALGPGRWAVFHLLEGSVTFLDLRGGEGDSPEGHRSQGHRLLAPAERVIEPEAPHRLLFDGPLRCRLDFYSR